MRILIWHVHGGYMNGFLRGAHDSLIPAGPGTPLPALPENARRVDPAAIRDEEIDVVVLQRLEELEWAASLTGRMPGRDLPAVFIEHNTPKRLPVDELHPLAERSDIPIVHVTHFNRLMWDTGRAPSMIIEHGIPDPGAHYTGELPALGLVVNEPVRRWRVAGTDLLPLFTQVAPLDAFGIDTDRLPGALGLAADRVRVVGDLPTNELHRELARRRAYLHPFRWTSLGLSLLEAMTLGMPVLALASTEAPRAVPPEAGAISADPEELCAAAARLLADPEEARRRGAVARAFATERYGLSRFLAEWTTVLEDTVAKTLAARRQRTHDIDTRRRRVDDAPADRPLRRGKD